MHTRFLFAVGGTVFAVMTHDAGAQAPRPMTIVDLMDIPGVGGPQLSPNGRQILYTVSRPDWKANKPVAHVWRVNVDGSGAAQMTGGPDGESAPKWSPDGKWIAFTARRGTVEGGQIYVMPTDGGEARPLTAHATSPTWFAWSPDGASIYFLAPEGKTPEEKVRDAAKDDVLSFDENYKLTHLWKISVADRREQRLTEGGFAVSGVRLSRDGTRIVMTRSPNPLLDTQEDGELWVMDASGGNAAQITRNKIGEGGAELSPDGTQILFTAGTNAKLETYYNRKLFVMSAAGGVARLLTPDFPYEIQNASWSKDGRSIYFSANMGVHSELFQLDVASGKPKQLTDGVHVVRGEYEPATEQFVMTISEPTNPGDIYVMPASGGTPTRVTHIFDFVARDYKLPREEKVTWTGADGVTVEGIVFYPLDYQPGQRYPLVVQTHGGPQASDQMGWSGASDYVQVLAAKGYAVLKPNYRGSTGYGDVFLRDMVGQYFKNAHKDVLAGVDYLIRTGLADSSRLAAMGWSAGGHMTNKLITFTNRFKAAASGAGAADWVSMYAQSDTRTYRTPWFGGTPWQKNAPIDIYWENSPLKYVSNVTTPTIFLVGEKDERVPSPQSIEMYRGLKSNGVPTHVYIAPREGHGWAELRHRLFKANVELDWFEKYVTKRSYAWEKAPAGVTNDVADVVPSR